MGKPKRLMKETKLSRLAKKLADAADDRHMKKEMEKLAEEAKEDGK